MPLLEPVRVVLDLHKVGIHGRNRSPRVAQQGNPHVHGQLLMNEDAPGIPNEQIDRVIDRPAAGILNGNNTKTVRGSDHSFKDGFDGWTRRQEGVSSKPFAGEDMRECPFGSQIVDRSHGYLLKRQPGCCK